MYRKIHPPRPSRFPLCGDFAPLGPRDCPRASPSGNLSGLGVQNPRPWEISWASGGVFSDTSLLSAVYGFNIHYTSSSTCYISKEFFECIAASECKHSLVTTGVSVSLIAINTVSLHLLRMAGPPC